MNVAWKIVVWTLCLNISSAIVTDFLVIDNNIDFDAEIIDNVDIYDVQGNGSVINTLPVEESQNWADNLLGLLGLGYLLDLVQLLVDYLFGFTDILMQILPSEAEPLRVYINSIISLAYSLALFSLFTGKDLNEAG